MKFLYFKDANNDAYMYPADNLISVIHDGDTTLKLFFAPASTNDAADTDLVTLTIASNKEQEVCEDKGGREWGGSRWRWWRWEWRWRW